MIRVRESGLKKVEAKGVFASEKFIGEKETEGELGRGWRQEQR